MASTLAKHPFRLTTPLGPDKLMPVTLEGTEALSHLFEFRLSLLAENATKVDFAKVIGQGALIELDLPSGKTRYFGGLCSRFSEGRRDQTFTRYSMEIVPQVWLLTRRTQSRIFQHINIKDILKAVLKGYDVKWDIQGTFQDRDYCVQYRESDFAFASRLMEEEGIYYYFEHTAKGHRMVVANSPAGHADVPAQPKVIYDDVRGGNRPDLRVTDWEKVQELRSGKVMLWDNCFELPQQHLEAQKTISESVKVGTVAHKLNVADNEKLELYDYPGAYAQRFDGVDPGGGDRPGDLKHIFEDNARVAKLRVEQEATESLEVRGASNCRQFAAGHKFALERHFNADGEYLLTGVTHALKMGADYRSGEGEAAQYENRFTCIPLALPFRPPQATPRPTVAGTQTATVVGAPGEIITCDKYGRVKVQFHWDRHGKNDADSSCWVRVSQNWGGAGWGGMFVPHHGQEVIVDFEEGDPDRPLIIGRVYNAETMPPLELPAGKTQSAIRDHGGNEIIMQGHPGDQQIKMLSPQFRTIVTMGAARNPPEGYSLDTDHFAHFIIKKDVNWDVDGKSDEDIEGDETISVHGHHKHTTTLTSSERVLISKELSILGFYSTHVGGLMNEIVAISRTENTGGWRAELTGAKKTERVIGPSSVTVGRGYTVTVGKDYTTVVKGKQDEATVGDRVANVKGDYNMASKQLISLLGRTVSLAAKDDTHIKDDTQIMLECGSSKITLEKGGKITIHGKHVLIKGDDKVEIESKDVSVSATAGLKMAGKPFELTSGSGGEIKTSAVLKVEGGQVKINC